MEVKQLPLSSVFPSPMNPRKTFDEAARDKVTAKFDRFRAKCEKNLKALGYGLDGKPLE